MSVVSAGGPRRGPPRDYRGPLPRGDFRPNTKPRNGRYAQSDICESFIPRFRATESEGKKYQMPQEEWAENTTVLTGMTNDSYTGEDTAKKVYDPPIGRVVSRRCSRLMWLLTSWLISLLAVLSAPVMCALPPAAIFLGYEFPSLSCDVDCQGLLLEMVIKTVILIVGIVALYVRRAAADLPRLYFARAAFAFFVLFVLFAYWLFYTVRILLERHGNYSYAIGYAISLQNALLFILFISFVVLELRKSRQEYIATITRDPDGETLTLSLGTMSLQEASIEVLKFYKTSFPVYNTALDRARSSGPNRAGPTSGGAGFKMYDIEGHGQPRETLSEVNTRALLEAAARRRNVNYTEIIQAEMDFERKTKKRKYRLLAACEDAFSHVQGIVDSQQQSNKAIGEPMDTVQAAKSVFTMISRHLSKYLKHTRQREYHPPEAITEHIERCLTMRFSHHTFLQRFFDDRRPLTEVVSESKWSIVSDSQSSGLIDHGTIFTLRSHDQDFDAGVQLLVSISSLPFFNLTEQSKSSINKFTLRLSGESSV